MQTPAEPGVLNTYLTSLSLEIFSANSVCTLRSDKHSLHCLLHTGLIQARSPMNTTQHDICSTHWAVCISISSETHPIRFPRKSEAISMRGPDRSTCKSPSTGYWMGDVWLACDMSDENTREREKKFCRNVDPGNLFLSNQQVQLGEAGERFGL